MYPVKLCGYEPLVLVKDLGGAGIRKNIEEDRCTAIDIFGRAYYLALDDRNDLGGENGRLEGFELESVGEPRVSVYKIASNEGKDK